MSETFMNNGQSSADRQARIILNRELHLIRLLGWGLLAGGCFLLGFIWDWSAAGQWIVQAGLLWWFVIYQTNRRIDLNRLHPETNLYHTLGWGNRLTLLRGGLIAATGGFLFQSWPSSYTGWLPGILYLFAAVIDRVDGYAARRSGQTSLLGVELDTVFDALGLTVASLLAVWYGQIHWTYLIFSSAYYLFQWGESRRRQYGLPVYPLPSGFLRRAWAGFQMGFLAVVLLPVFHPPVTSLAGIAFMLPVLIGFAVDWLIVSGRINRQAVGVVVFFNRLQVLSQTVFQPGLRVIIAVMLLLVVQQSGLSLIPVEGVSWHYTLIVYGFALTAGLILLGIAGRVAALVLVLLLGWYYLSHSLDLIDHVLLFSVIWLLLLGSGRFSLWQGDDDWVNRYDGV